MVILTIFVSIRCDKINISEIDVNNLETENILQFLIKFNDKNNKIKQKLQLHNMNKFGYVKAVCTSHKLQ